MGAPTPLVLLPLWCSYPLGCSYPLVLLRWVLLPLGCSYPIGCSYPLRFVFVLVDVSLLMGGLRHESAPVSVGSPSVGGGLVGMVGLLARGGPFRARTLAVSY